MNSSNDIRQRRREELTGFQARLLAELTKVVSERRRAAKTFAEAKRVRPARRAGRAGGGRRLRLQVAAVGLAFAAGIAAVQLADAGPEPVRVGQGSVAVDDVLRELAAVTERQPATKPGAVRYTRMLERRLVVGRLGGTTWVGHVQATVETWTRRSNGAYRERRSEIEVTFPSGRDRANHQRWVAAGSPNHHDIPANYWPEVAGLRPSDRTEEPGHVVPVTDTVLGLKLADLPTNPAALAKIIRASQAVRRFADNTQDAPIEHKMWAWLEEGLWHPDASPKLQAAMLRVAAGLKGVQVRRGAADLTGRVGDAISFRFVNQAVFQATIIVDPRTGVLLSRSDALLDRRGQDSLRLLPLGEHSTVVHLASGGVASLRQIP
jgi:hypothetical protein